MYVPAQLILWACVSVNNSHLIGSDALEEVGFRDYCKCVIRYVGGADSFHAVTFTCAWK